MPTNQLVTAIIIVVAIDVCIVPLIVKGMIDACWKPIEKTYPFAAAPPPSPAAVRREFCRLKVGMMSVNGGMHLTADEAHLRLEPCLICRWFGMRAAAVPWSEITLLRHRSKRTSIVKIRGVEIVGPRDLLSLAQT